MGSGPPTLCLSLSLSLSVTAAPSGPPLGPHRSCGFSLLALRGSDGLLSGPVLVWVTQEADVERQLNTQEIYQGGPGGEGTRWRRERPSCPQAPAQQRPVPRAWPTPPLWLVRHWATCGSGWPHGPQGREGGERDALGAESRTVVSLTLVGPGNRRNTSSASVSTLVDHAASGACARAWPCGTKELSGSKSESGRDGPWGGNTRP